MLERHDEEESDARGQDNEDNLGIGQKRKNGFHAEEARRVRGSSGTKGWMGLGISLTPDLASEASVPLRTVQRWLARSRPHGIQPRRR